MFELKPQEQKKTLGKFVPSTANVNVANGFHKRTTTVLNPSL